MIVQWVLICLIFCKLSDTASVYNIDAERRSHRELPLPPPVDGFEFLTWISWDPDYSGKWLWLSTNEDSRENMEYACHRLHLVFDEHQVAFYNHLKFYLECTKEADETEMVPKIQQATFQILNKLNVKKTMWSGHFDMLQEDEDKRCMIYQWNSEDLTYEEVPAPSCIDNYLGLCAGVPLPLTSFNDNTPENSATDNPEDDEGPASNEAEDDHLPDDEAMMFNSAMNSIMSRSLLSIGSKTGIQATWNTKSSESSTDPDDDRSNISVTTEDTVSESIEMSTALIRNDILTEETSKYDFDNTETESITTHKLNNNAEKFETTTIKENVDKPYPDLLHSTDESSNVKQLYETTSTSTIQELSGLKSDAKFAADTESSMQTFSVTETSPTLNSTIDDGSKQSTTKKSKTKRPRIITTTTEEPETTPEATEPAFVAELESESKSDFMTLLQSQNKHGKLSEPSGINDVKASPGVNSKPETMNLLSYNSLDDFTFNNPIISSKQLKKVQKKLKEIPTTTGTPETTTVTYSKPTTTSTVKGYAKTGVTTPKSTTIKPTVGTTTQKTTDMTTTRIVTDMSPTQRTTTEASTQSTKMVAIPQSTTPEAITQVSTAEPSPPSTTIEIDSQGMTSDTPPQSSTIEITMDSSTIENIPELITTEITSESTTMETRTETPPVLTTTLPFPPTRTFVTTTQITTVGSTKQSTTGKIQTQKPMNKPTIQKTTIGTSTSKTTVGPTTKKTTISSTTQKTTAKSTTQKPPPTQKTTRQPTTQKTTIRPVKQTTTTIGPTQQKTTTIRPTTVKTTIGPATKKTTIAPTTQGLEIATDAQKTNMDVTTQNIPVIEVTTELVSDVFSKRSSTDVFNEYNGYDHEIELSTLGDVSDNDVVETISEAATLKDIDDTNTDNVEGSFGEEAEDESSPDSDLDMDLGFGTALNAPMSRSLQKPRQYITTKTPVNQPSYTHSQANEIEFEASSAKPQITTEIRISQTLIGVQTSQKPDIIISDETTLKAENDLSFQPALNYTETDDSEIIESTSLANTELSTEPTEPAIVKEMEPILESNSAKAEKYLKLLESQRNHGEGSEPSDIDDTKISKAARKKSKGINILNYDILDGFEVDHPSRSKKSKKAQRKTVFTTSEKPEATSQTFVKHKTTRSTTIGTTTQEVSVSAYETPVDTTTEPFPIKTTTNLLPIRTVVQQVPIETSTQQVSTRTGAQKNPIKTTTQSIPIETTTQNSPIKITTQKTPTKTTTQQTPTKTTTQAIPIKTTTQPIPIDTTTQQTTIKTASQQPLINTTTQSTVVETTTQSTPAKTTTHQVPIKTTTQNIPSKSTTDKTVIETNTPQTSIENKLPITTIRTRRHKLPMEATIQIGTILTASKLISTESTTEIPQSETIAEKSAFEATTKNPLIVTKTENPQIETTTKKLSIDATTTSTTFQTTTTKLIIGITTQNAAIVTTTEKSTISPIVQKAVIGSIKPKTTVGPTTKKTTIGPTTKKTTIGTTTKKITLGTTTRKSTIARTTKKTRIGPISKKTGTIRTTTDKIETPIEGDYGDYNGYDAEAEFTTVDPSSTLDETTGDAFDDPLDEETEDDSLLDNDFDMDKGFGTASNAQHSRSLQTPDITTENSVTHTHGPEHRVKTEKPKTTKTPHTHSPQHHKRAKPRTRPPPKSKMRRNHPRTAAAQKPKAGVSKTGQNSQSRLSVAKPASQNKLSQFKGKPNNKAKPASPR